MPSSSRQRKSGNREIDLIVNPEFLMPKADVKAAISIQIDKGKQLHDLPINTQEELTDAHSKESKWTDFTAELLRRAFNNRVYADEFEGRGLPAGAFLSLAPTPFSKCVHDYQKGIQQHLSRLESIYERLDLIPETSGSRLGVPRDPSLSQSGKVFVVYGRDEGLKNGVCNFLRKLELDPIVLRDQPNSGKTLIEKFEAESDVGYVVVLLTGDDEGRLVADGEVTKRRARQNVIFELGYFFGKYGRDKVCALYKGGVEFPSDITGLVYVLLDEREAWHRDLARELKAADIPFDAEKLLS
ncbi:MAG: nucleotide-binding protein [bacterium]|nr:nucleotide-binding protein [bacterium]